MSIGRILVVEPDELLAGQLLEQLQQQECDTTVVGTVTAALAGLAEQEFDLVITELTLPDGTAAGLLEHLGRSPKPVPLLVISEFGSVESAMDCLRQGACGYLFKPFSRAQVEAILHQAAEHARLLRLAQLAGRDPDGNGWELLGESPAMGLLRQTVRQVARTGATVLISGEGGAGKHRVAHALHAQSARARAPLVSVDCSRLPESRLARELFGQEGTGGGNGPGRIELAAGGTLLLREIGDLAPEVQERLLKFLQHGTVQRLGGRRLHPVDARVLATSSRPLEDLVQRKAFREDLYLRLNLVPIAVPPLRERKSDIPLLAEHFRHRFARKHGSPALAVSPECIAALQAYQWPGNVRELANAIERAVQACTDGNVLEPVHLGGATGASQPSVPPPAQTAPDALSAVEKQHILAVLAKYQGNRTHAARCLGISIRTLRNKLKEYRTAANGAGAPGASGDLVVEAVGTDRGAVRP